MSTDKLILEDEHGRCFDHGHIWYGSESYTEVELHVVARVELVLDKDRRVEFKKELEELIKKYAL
jgi:hypothetical protein